MAQGKDGNRREYDRFALGLKVRIYAADGDERRMLEDSVLRDVSGGGASFSSVEPGRYHVGQHLQLVIMLPGTDRLDARMEGRATVIHVDKPGADGKALVGVSMDDVLDFRRSAISPDGEGA